MVLLLCGIMHYTKKTNITHMTIMTKTDSHTDDLVTVRGNEKLLGQSEITKGVLDFLEVGMKYNLHLVPSPVE